MTNRTAGGDHPVLVAVGCLNVDLLAVVPALPGHDDRVMSAPFDRQPGGMAANVASAAAGLGAPWPVDARLVAPIGADESSRWLESGLRARGVDTRWLDRTSNPRATTCLVLIEPDGQRAIVSEPSRLSDEPLASCLGSGADGGARWVHVDGFHAVTAREQVARAAARGWRSSLDLDELADEHLTVDGLLAFVAVFDTVFVNRARACAVLGARSVAAWTREMCRWSDHTATVFLLTLGEDGVVVIRPGAAPEPVRPPRVECVDSTGAGDVFAGVYASCSLHGLDEIEAARMACIGGAVATTRHGALGAAPTAAAIRSMERL